MPAPPAPRTASSQPCRRPPSPAPARPPRAFLDLGAVLTAPACARAWTREILWEWGLACLADTAEIVVSELVTNSVNASRGLERPFIRLILTLDRGEMAILVRDDHPGAPQARRPGADDESGRGLLLAEVLSDRFVWYPLGGDARGKVVWAALRAPGSARACFIP
jgi:anti-sigma regulatory factor (Ser/Thr protein kinase)